MVGGREPTGANPTQPRGPTTGVGVRPTTLSGASGEVEGEEPRKSRMPLVAAAAALVVIGVGGAVVMTRGKDKPIEPPAAVVTPPPPKDEMVKVSVRSDPPGAKVYRADTGEAEQGVTPLSFSVKKGAQALELQVKLDGYKPGLKRITVDEDTAVLVPLEKDAPPPVAPVAVVPPPVAPEGGDKPKKRHSSSSTSSSSSSTSSSGKKNGGEEGNDDMKLLQPKF
jgi:hypothetical protein